MEENIKKIREACIKANPEIMELKFGCEVMTEGVLTPESITGTLETESGVVIRVDTFVYTDAPVSIVNKILGRPIRLADVLLALMNRLKNDTRHDLYICGLILENTATKGKLWNLREDDLTKQSPETIDFIASLL